MSDDTEGAIRRLIVESGRLLAKGNGKERQIPTGFQQTVIFAIQEYNEAVMKADNKLHGDPLISSSDFS